MTTVENRVVLEHDYMVYQRANQARTELDLADVNRIGIVSRAERCYWHLTTPAEQEALVPMGVPGENRMRQYLSRRRGFDYDGLIRFVSEPPDHGHRCLWPLG